MMNKRSKRRIIKKLVLDNIELKLRFLSYKKRRKTSRYDSSWFKIMTSKSPKYIDKMANRIIKRYDRKYNDFILSSIIITVVSSILTPILASLLSLGMDIFKDKTKDAIKDILSRMQELRRTKNQKVFSALVQAIREKLQQVMAEIRIDTNSAMSEDPSAKPKANRILGMLSKVGNALNKLKT